MFEIHQVGAKVTAVTNRAEKHGKQLVPAQTIRLSFITSAMHLDELKGDQSLRKSLFKKASKHRAKNDDDDPEQTEIPMQDNGDLVEVKFTQVPSITYKEKLPGYLMFVGSGLTATGEVEQGSVTLSDFTLTPKDGGSVQIDCNASFTPDMEHAGFFAFQVQQLVNISLIPPDSELQQEIEETQEAETVE